MSAVVNQARPFNPQAAAVQLMISWIMAFGVFLSGFVISEPAPYELLMVGQVALWFLFGLKISRVVAPLLALLLIFNVGGLLALTMLRTILTEQVLYVAVSIFLALTAVFYAAVIEDRPQRLKLIFQAWVAAAIITGMLGILGYFHAFPGAEMFTRYDRAMGAFQDPNVFGPFLVAPTLYLMHGMLKGRLLESPLRIVGILILSLAVFLSFSRAAWGLFLFCTVALIFVMLLKERTNAFRLKILVLSLAAVVAMVLALSVALQFEKVQALFETRTQLVQEYDGGHLGRFARHRLGFELAMERPLGIGPMMFGRIFPEDEHNIWLKSLMAYGWIGFVSYVMLMIWTVSMGFRYLLRERPWQPYLMVAWIVLVGHILIGNVIDTDHWRHFYLVLGIVWGCGAAEWRHQRALRN
ncbi:O-antigen ligase family protein [Rhizobium rosettiformans]|uniref:O-antigen ligase family protein n=1 Tax=Rhizobium rosettiformans TaxID=1368430 RepID=A0ABX7EWX6_9HYPH|nr:O-antigen ligase family protein [Rhizobium rosettiformans]QRF52629.1 O-antigen ligase family protein [Rhizobium rosettiformans]